ncbi:hypothetical protein CAF53_06830 [Sphingobium sp. LB126]|uniref:hypothetical protein n=1 Tax=Sphingobium sp. LB126 TaxID=1983755 RepID=UPI000C208324|nr:hypothetical protein [Sphingobium sp. LB126]PJG49724.1 hypothetical protein CAF53_06830 [Sphingobium sp. LB126]
MKHHDLSTKEGRKAHRHELRMIAVRPRRWGLWLLTAGFLLLLTPSALDVHSLFGLWPPMLGALCIILGVALLGASVVLKRRYMRQRMAGQAMVGRIKG